MTSSTPAVESLHNKLNQSLSLSDSQSGGPSANAPTSEDRTPRPVPDPIAEAEEALMRQYMKYRNEKNTRDLSWDLPFHADAEKYFGFEIFSDDGLKKYEGVLGTLNHENLPQYALSLRQKMDPNYDGLAPTVFEPLIRSDYICYPLNFNDGSRWLAQFPSAGHEAVWDDHCCRALASEAETMMMLKKETTIPMPQVITFSLSFDNELGCPHMITTYIQGRSLYDVWWGNCNGIHDTSQETEAARLRALRDIASAMKQLSRFSFDKGGFLSFAADGAPSVGPMRVVDHRSTLTYWGRDEPIYTGGTPLYVNGGPFAHPEDQGAIALNLRERLMYPIEEKAKDMVKLLMSCLPGVAEGNQFDLGLSDFNFQNFTVSTDGELLGIVNWEGVAAFPLAVGSRKYPYWLTTDWWVISNGPMQLPGLLEGGYLFHSPEMLKHYRRIYQEFMAEGMAEVDGQLSAEFSLELTRKSRITSNLWQAAMDPRYRCEVVGFFASQVEGLTAAGNAVLWGTEEFHDIADRIPREEALERLMRGFLKLLEEQV